MPTWIGVLDIVCGLFSHAFAIFSHNVGTKVPPSLAARFSGYGEGALGPHDDSEGEELGDREPLHPQDLRL